MTLSTTRTKEDDAGGAYICSALKDAGHSVVWYEVLKDDGVAISAALRALRENDGVDLIIATGGTGLAPSDVTVEAARALFDKEITAFGVLFTVLSHQQVGTACVLSRATAGVLGKKIVCCLPGSPKACRLAMEQIILPEAGHMVKHARGS